MTFEAPVALKRLVIHPSSSTSKTRQFVFSPLIWGVNELEEADMIREVAPALAETYVNTDFQALTMGSPFFLWANETVLESMDALLEHNNLNGFVVPMSAISHPNWPALRTHIEASGLSITLMGNKGVGHETAADTGAHAVCISARRPHVSTMVAEARERGFKVMITDAPRSFLNSNLDLGDAYLGPVYYSREVNRDPLAPGEAQCLEALRLLSMPDANLAEVSAVLSLDPEMVIRVLHLANSAAIGALQRIDSLSHALVYLGGQRISSLVMTSMISSRHSDPHAMWFVLTRAAVCRELTDGAEPAYTAGLLSALAEDVGEAPEAMAIRAGVSFEVSLALSSGAGDLGAVVEAVRAYERGDIDSIVRYGLDPVAVADSYLRALPNTLSYMKLLYGDSVVS